MVRSSDDFEESYEVDTFGGPTRVVLATAAYASDDDDDAQGEAAALLAAFEESPEAKALTTSGQWPDMLLEYADEARAARASTISADVLEEVLFEAFPRAVSCDASAAKVIITELRAFFTYLERELGFENAAECLDVLGADAEEALRDVLSDPGNFGVAKSFVMAGKQAGYDMTTQEGMEAWMLRSSALTAAAAPHSATGTSSTSSRSAAEKAKKRNKRKSQRKGRRKNR